MSTDDAEETKPSCCASLFGWLCCCCGKHDDSSDEDEESQSDKFDEDEETDNYNPLSPEEKAAIRAHRQLKAQQEGTYVSNFARRRQPGAPPRPPTESHVLNVSPLPMAASSQDEEDNIPPLLRRSSSVRFTEVTVVHTPGDYPSESQLVTSETIDSFDPQAFTVPTDIVVTPATIESVPNF